MSNSLIPVSSSSIESIGYGTKKKALIVKFLNGGVYVYEDVTQKIFNDFLSVSSKGQYHSQFIKGQFTFRMIDEGDISDWLDAPKSPRKTPYLVPEIFNGFQGAAAFF